MTGDRREAVRGVLLLGDDCVLAVQPRHSGDWILPGGGMEDEEFPDDTLRREFREEVNLDVAVTAWIMAIEEPGVCGSCEAMRQIRAQRSDLSHNDMRTDGCYRQYFMVVSQQDVLSSIRIADSEELMAVGTKKIDQLTCPLDRAAVELARRVRDA